MDTIRIDNLKVFAHHGVFDFEQKEGQDFYINAVFFLSLLESGQTDDLTKSVSYAQLCEFMFEFLTKHTFQLIETAAEQLTEALLNTYPAVERIDLEIRKPQAPIALEFESVSVRISRKRHLAAIASGSNLGNSREIIKHAYKQINEDACCRILKSAALLSSTPYGGVEQPDFVNGAILVETYYEPVQLLKFLQKIELEHGRERKVHWGPRTLDLDILLYDNLVLDSPELTIPHPDMTSRDFVLFPLEEIAAWYRHPVLNQRIEQLAKHYRDSQMQTHIKEQ